MQRGHLPGFGAGTVLAAGPWGDQAVNTHSVEKLWVFTTSSWPLWRAS